MEQIRRRFNLEVIFSLIVLFLPWTIANAQIGVFVPTGSLTTVRCGAQATVLDGGKVLVVGGEGSKLAMMTADLYDPKGGVFTSAGAMVFGRAYGHTATRLYDGQVLITGGFTPSGIANEGAFTASAELYHPTTETFSATGSMTFARSGATATLLHDGKVLIVGGWNNAALAARG